MTGTGLGAILFGPAKSQCSWNYRPSLSGDLTCSRRSDHFGRKYILYGNCRTFCYLRCVQALRKAEGKQTGFRIPLQASLGDLITYCITSLRLAMAYPSEVGGFAASLAKFMGIFATTQVPLAVVEGILTVIIIIGLESFAKPELKAIGFIKEGQIIMEKKSRKRSGNSPAGTGNTHRCRSLLLPFAALSSEVRTMRPEVLYPKFRALNMNRGLHLFWKAIWAEKFRAKSKV